MAQMEVLILAILSLLLFPFASALHSFINFTQFSFNHSSPAVQTMVFSLDDSEDVINSQLNISLSTDDNSGTVITARLCQNGNKSAKMRQQQEQEQFGPSQPLLFGTSLAYESMLLRPGNLSKGGKCHRGNASEESDAESSQFILELSIHSLVPGSRGTIAVRPTEEREMQQSIGNAVDGESLAMEQRELAILDGKIGDYVLTTLNGPIGSEFGEMDKFQLDLAIRRGWAMISIVQECPSWNATAPAWNRTFPLGNFSVGEFPKFIVGTAPEPYEQEFNISTILANGTGINMFLECPPHPLSSSLLDDDDDDDANDSNNRELAKELGGVQTGNASSSSSSSPPSIAAADDSPPPLLFLVISSSSSSSSSFQPNNSITSASSPFPPPSAGLIIAFFTTRQFRSILVEENAFGEEEEAQNQSKGGWGIGTILLFGILMPFILMATITFVALVAYNLLVHQKMEDYQKQRQKALEQQMGFFEINLTERGRAAGANRAVNGGQSAAASVANRLRGSQQRPRRIQPMAMAAILASETREVRVIDANANANKKNVRKSRTAPEAPQQIDMVALCRNAVGQRPGWI